MYCKKCGKQIPDESRFCTYCGQMFVEEKPMKRTRKTSATAGESSQDEWPEKLKWLLNIALCASILYTLLLFLAHSSYEVSVKQRDGGTVQEFPRVYVDVTIVDKLSKGALGLGFCRGFSEFDCTAFTLGRTSSFYLPYTEQNLAEYQQKVIDQYKSANGAWIAVFAVISAVLYLIKRYWLKRCLI